MIDQAGIPILDWLLAQTNRIDPAPLNNLASWRARWTPHLTAWEQPVDRAIIGGFLADRMAYAFAAGYQSALNWLVPELPREAVAALCVTEEGSAHPRDISTKLRDGRVHGEKHFVTNAREAEILLVVASAGQAPDGHNLLHVARADRTMPGITVRLVDDLPFIPEISHGRVWLDGVNVGAEGVLPGDGYTRYVKPFRTVEDLHIFAGLLGYVFRTASRYKWPGAARTEALSLLITIRTLAACDPLAPEVHIALAGLIRQLRRYLADLAPHWERVDAVERERWERDRPLLAVAEKARTARLESAWRQYGLSESVK
jgi:hypothetical protein